MSYNIREHEIENGFGLEISHTNVDPLNLSEILLTEGREETLARMDEYGFLLIKDDTIDLSKSWGVQNTTSGRNRRQNFRSFFWHKDLEFPSFRIEDVVLALHKPPHEECLPEAPLTGIGKEAIIIPTAIEELQELISDLDEYGRDIPVPKQDDYLKFVFDFYTKIAKAYKEGEDLQRFLPGLGATCKALGHSLRNYDSSEQARTYALVSIFRFFEDFHPVNRFYKRVDNSLGNQVYRQEWKPRETVLFPNNGDILHARISRSDRLINSPLYAINIPLV